MSDKRKYNIDVSVFRGEPIDFSKYRHTGIFFEPADDPEGIKYYFHVVGTSESFRYERRVNWIPDESKKFASSTELGETKVAIGAEELASLMQSVPVRNYDREFNCQQWIEAALLALRNKGYISDKQYQDGVNGMVDSVMEAKDEVIA